MFDLFRAFAEIELFTDGSGWEFLINDAVLGIVVGFGIYGIIYGRAYYKAWKSDKSTSFEMWKWKNANPRR